MQKQSVCYFPLLQLQHAGVCWVLLVGGAAGGRSRLTAVVIRASYCEVIMCLNIDTCAILMNVRMSETVH